MRKIPLILNLLFAFVISVNAGYVSNSGKMITLYQTVNQSNFFMYGKWLCADTVAMPVSGIVSYGGEYEVEPFFFQEFDYIPNTKIDILERVHPQDKYSVPSEGKAVFQVKYYDKYENDPGNDYPKLVLTYPDNSVKTYTMTSLSNDGIFSYEIVLLSGEYKYEYIATNDYYTYNDGCYNLAGKWYVTSRPYINAISPVNNVEILPDNVRFQWDISTDEANDILKYELYLGTDNDKNKLKKAENGPGNNVKSYIYPTSLNHMSQYCWYMRVINKYGADMETDLFYFRTGGQVEKFYNAPNPFNPARGQPTRFVFAMPQSGTVKLVIYSEYGDKVWESETYNYIGDMISSKEITYDGKDNSGKMLYNGTYIAVLTKKYGGKTNVEKCRIIIIK
ncbi:MAG: hypothetical protein LBD46_01605 [Endomicrobium sp.]|jgi:hypothetical protein|nr:hypothetical protein [Endomicrobium sp.]